MADVVGVRSPIRLLLRKDAGAVGLLQCGDRPHQQGPIGIVELEIGGPVVLLQPGDPCHALFDRRIVEVKHFLRLAADLWNRGGHCPARHQFVDRVRRRRNQMGDAVVAGDAIHPLEEDRIDRLGDQPRLHIDVLGDQPVGVHDPHQGDLLLHRIQSKVQHLILDVPVDSTPQPLAGGAASSLHVQIDADGSVFGVWQVALDLPQAVIRELLRKVAALAGLARGTEFFGMDGEFVLSECLPENVLQIAGLARYPSGGKAPPDVTLDAIHPCMRRDEIGGVFGRHGVAGGATELRRIGVVPGVGAGGQDSQSEQAQGRVADQVHPPGRSGRRKEEMAKA